MLPNQYPALKRRMKIQQSDESEISNFRLEEGALDRSKAQCRSDGSEGAAVHGEGPEGFQSLQVLTGRVALVRSEAILRVAMIQSAHDRVAGSLRNDRCCRDAE